MLSEPSCRKDFPALTRLIDGHLVCYLDNAATTLKPRSVIDAVSSYYELNGANVHRGRHFLSAEASHAYEEVRTKVAQFIGAFGNEIVFVKNSTEAINLVAHGLRLQPTDLVVGCLDSHHSQMLPWMRTATLQMVRFNREGEVDVDHYVDLLRLKPRVVALTHCSNVTGAITPIAEMAALAKNACSATIVVDSAQFVPHHRINVGKLPVDFVVFSGHKMLAPTGVGCLFGRGEALEQLLPLSVGGGMVDWVQADGFRERRIPHRFEAGTPPISSVLGLGAAIDYLLSGNEASRFEHSRSLTESLINCARSCEFVELLGPEDPSKRCPIASFAIRGCRSLTGLVGALSDSYGVMCRNGHMCAQPFVDMFAEGEVLRASAYIYNSVSEIEFLFSALRELVPWFTRS